MWRIQKISTWFGTGVEQCPSGPAGEGSNNRRWTMDNSRIYCALSNSPSKHSEQIMLFSVTTRWPGQAVRLSLELLFHLNSSFGSMTELRYDGKRAAGKLAPNSQRGTCVGLLLSAQCSVTDEYEQESVNYHISASGIPLPLAYSVSHDWRKGDTKVPYCHLPSPLLGLVSRSIPERTPDRQLGSLLDVRTLDTFCYY